MVAFSLKHPRLSIWQRLFLKSRKNRKKNPLGHVCPDPK